MTSITLIISGSIAAIKAPELVRQLVAKKIDVHCIVTKSGKEFVSMAELEVLSGNPVSLDLFDEKEKKEMWHIRFSRETDLIVVAPATADIIAKMAHGIADDMATATLLANNKKLLVAPAMNTYMWIHPATQRNVAQIQRDGAVIIEPGIGMLACGEVGAGRMAEPEKIVAEIERMIKKSNALKGKKALVTAGPTHEPIDPVRYIANHSSGKQGYAIAKALAAAGAEVTLVAGPTHLPDPMGMKVVHVKTAKQMFAACEKALPAEIAVFAAAVGDWGVKESAQKIKKTAGQTPSLKLIENPDILRFIASYIKRPKLVIGFAAETQNLALHASKKHKSKGADWVLANDVSDGKVFGEDENQVIFLDGKTKQPWPRMSKDQVASTLVDKIIKVMGVKK